MRPLLLFIPAFLALTFCRGGSRDRAELQSAPSPDIVPAGATIAGRFPPPAGYGRVAVVPASFDHYLRNLVLEPEGAPVHLYDGGLKPRQDVHAAVITMSVGKTDLQQCADAIMRLRAEYLFANARQDEISFHFTSGFPAPWNRWRAGERISVKGNSCSWVPGGTADASHAQLLRYLDRVFTYAGSRSLEKELLPANAVDLRTGDVFIQGGSPGHAMLVVDVAKHANGQQAFMLAQSYMPAQQIHVVKNLRHPELGAWFVLEGDDQLYTPEWTFSWTDRRRWR